MRHRIANAGALRPRRTTPAMARPPIVPMPLRPVRVPVSKMLGGWSAAVAGFAGVARDGADDQRPRLRGASCDFDGPGWVAARYGIGPHPCRLVLPGAWCAAPMAKKVNPAAVRGPGTIASVRFIAMLSLRRGAGKDVPCLT